MAKAVGRWIFETPEDLPPWEPGTGGDALAAEEGLVRALADRARLAEPTSAEVLADARALVARVRESEPSRGGLDAFLSEYDLGTREGVVLMCLAEALLRIPDAETADRLIEDKLGTTDFEAHLGGSESLFVNATTWALMLSGRLLREPADSRGLSAILGNTLGRLGEPLLRGALRQAMRILGQQFVMGRDIEEALRRARRDAPSGERHSFDMLGEAALTAADARRYTDAYAQAIAAVAYDRRHSGGSSAASVSIKLSALCPRFEFAQYARAVREIGDRLLVLLRLAERSQVELTIDAEEADRLDLTLSVFVHALEAVRSPEWPGLGLAVQAYQKRALPVIEWLEAVAARLGRRVPVRLVKGAYWDTEIKRAQEQGLCDYPVFTRKTSTDVSYLACARTLLERCAHLEPRFATHNAHTLAWMAKVGAGRSFELERLHGMGEALYREARSLAPGHAVRVYAPVGSHAELLPYLVRRLLENGANTSFVNRVLDRDLPVEEVVVDPVAATDALADNALRHPRIPLPSALFGVERENSAGLNRADPAELLLLAQDLETQGEQLSRASPMIADAYHNGCSTVSVLDPAAKQRRIGEIEHADADSARLALQLAAAAFPAWNREPAARRAVCLRRAAAAMEAERAALVRLLCGEAGRQLGDALDEVREAVDLLRYYAAECERLFSKPRRLSGPTGECNELVLTGRGVFLCISPWNFPLAIFSGQVAAALAAGNTVLAKPAEQAGLVAARAVEILRKAGVPPEALHFLPGSGPALGAALLGDPRLAGVAFTGSVATARAIAARLAARPGLPAMLIAETGGVNAMIVDSSALPEQVVRDALRSAFNSAGQRCSALRLLCLQEEIAPDLLAMLTGAMAELRIGLPRWLKTDVGPVIDAEAQRNLVAYLTRHSSRIRYQCPLPPEAAQGWFVPPTLIELERVADLEGEIFGPVLHVVCFRARDIDVLVDEINLLGYGLTLGIQTRIDALAQRIARRARVGNVYVNRNMIGAMVGAQPFGGMGLSGTGPKTGGPHYVPRFAIEQVVSVNTAAIGGNADLLSLSVAD